MCPHCSSCGAFVVIAPNHSTRKRLPSFRFATNDDDDDAKHALLEHSDVEWRLRPPEGTSRLQRMKLKLGASILRLDSKLRGQTLPPVLCPRGGQALLEGYLKGD